MTRLLAVSRSGYYKWRSVRAAGPSQAQRVADSSMRRSKRSTRALTTSMERRGSSSTCGVTGDRLPQDDRRLDASTGLRRYQRTHLHVGHDSGRLRYPQSKDRIDRRFDQGELDKVWTSDLTYLRTGAGWLYLCAVRDGCSRRVIGWAIAEHMHTDLVEAAPTMAVAVRGQRPERMIFHADRDSQYTSGLLARFARAHNLDRSVGRISVLGQCSSRIILGDFES